MKYSILLLPFLFALIAPLPAFAEQTPNCQPIFNGGPSCEYNPPISLNKQVQNPENKNYVDSLIATDPQYAGGQTVLFKLTITNTSDAAVNNLEVVDAMPQYIEYSKGQGKYDFTTRKVTFTIDQLKGKEAKVFFIEGKVTAANKLPDTPSARCVINQSHVTANNKTSYDNTLLCLSKGTVATNPSTTKGGQQIYPPSNTKSTPGTGPETMALAALAPMGALGWWLRRKS